MRKLSEPINGTETYLAAILDELRALRVAVGDRSLARFVDERISEALGEVANAVHYADAPVATPLPGPVDPGDPFKGLVTTSDLKPTKRTRARTPR